LQWKLLPNTGDINKLHFLCGLLKIFHHFFSSTMWWLPVGQHPALLSNCVLHIPLYCSLPDQCKGFQPLHPLCRDIHPEGGNWDICWNTEKPSSFSAACSWKLKLYVKQQPWKPMDKVIKEAFLLVSGSYLSSYRGTQYYSVCILHKMHWASLGLRTPAVVCLYSAMLLMA
jgi:hypothetical protein